MLQDPMRIALEISKKCLSRETSFSVGAVITSETGDLISSGYTGELGEKWHAEEVAIHKALLLGTNLSRCGIFCTMEPCGERRSKPICCAEHIIRNKIKKVTYCIKEPETFVKPRGLYLLAEAGVNVEQDERFISEVLAINKNNIK